MDPDARGREVQLGEAGIAYVRDVLRTGGPLARALDSLDLDAGIASAFLPHEVVEPPERLQDGLGYNFHQPFQRRKHDYEQLMQLTRERIMAHFDAFEGRGWAVIEDTYDAGLGAFVNARMDGRETRFKLARAGESGILYRLGSADEHDVEDFLDAATIHANVSALGAGGPIGLPAQEAEAGRRTSCRTSPSTSNSSRARLSTRRAWSSGRTALMRRDVSASLKIW